jgi:hypothetical protein
MPSQFDTSYQNEYAKPTFDSEDDKRKYEIIREADYVLERVVPRLPTRDEEINYIDW